MTTEGRTTGIDTTYHSDQHKTGDRTGMVDGATSGQIAKRDFGDRVSDMADDVAHKAKEAGETIMDKASDVGHYMQETGHDIAEKSKHTHKAVCNFTRANPTASVLMAFALGAIVARIMPGR